VQIAKRPEHKKWDGNSNFHAQFVLSAGKIHKTTEDERLYPAYKKRGDGE